MKALTTTLFLFSFLLHTPIICQKTYHPTSTIEKVVVYEKGAMITRSIDVSHIDEAGMIIIDSLPHHINSKSLQVTSGEGIKIISVKFEVETTKTTLPPTYYQNIELLSQLQDSSEYYTTVRSSIHHEIGVITDNDNFETTHGVDIDQISKASTLYKSRLRELRLEEFEINLKIRNLLSKIETLKSEQNVLIPNPYQNYKAVIKVDTPKPYDRSMTVSYFTPNATWYTYYDLRISEDKENLLDQKAYVSQSTGEDWKNVKLTLSNRNPNKRILPPTISPYVLQNNRHNAYNQNRQGNYNNRIYPVIHGNIFDTEGNELIGASINIKGTNINTISDIDGSFSIQTSGKNTLIVTYLGYQTQEIDIRGLSKINITLHESHLLDEIVVTGLGGRSAGLGYAVPPIQKKKKEERKSISIKEQQSLNVNSFEIDRLYTIPSDSEEYDVLLKTNTIPFIFNYLIYPSIEPIAYLNVGIPDWESYNLFSGDVNLFLEGQYTGVSTLDIAEKKDTLWFSLGEDIGVNVERDPVKEYNKSSFFKNKTIELHTFDIEIKNNKTKNITTTIMDQVPITTDEDIEVKILEISQASHNKDNGYLTWKDLIKSGGKRKYRISYEIKYGKNVDVVNK